MTNSENPRWENLVSLSAPTFAGDDAPPFGFTTGFLAHLREQTEQRAMVERIGLHALFVSLAMLLVTGAVTFGLDHFRQGDLEPGVRSLIQVDHVQAS